MTQPNLWQRMTTPALALAIAAAAPLAGGCESLPGNEKQQGTVIGGLGGAAAGAAIGGEDNRLLGALIGGAAGAGGGYLVGANWDKISGDDQGDAADEARTASQKAEREPASAEEVRNARTADANGDGFVTLDEIAAMESAGLSDREMIERLRRTDQYFELTSEQARYLRERGVSDEVIDAMQDLNRDSVRTYRERSGSSMGGQRISR
jgi:hypothetical protein